MENVKTQNPIKAEQILNNALDQSDPKELRESLRNILFDALRSDFTDNKADRAEYLADFEAMENLLKDLEGYQLSTQSHD
ncbi:hypothetical protein [[Muricauda] lutisoli]|uniref:Uncharacterized protein n=1 Tax=[Muricauda] lutisoli TaxID=2816035 RepID=A0ABS3EZK1_9FLAO|nr:hypothetical protein [[Muricauda] lutisoli]MBO0331137.1 hypothetical protein [[Muricauda] lutisoli]